MAPLSGWGQVVQLNSPSLVPVGQVDCSMVSGIGHQGVVVMLPGVLVSVDDGGWGGPDDDGSLRAGK